jgi:hypothetical protein
MNVFQLLKTLCKGINAMMAKFWWGRKGNDKLIAWMSWGKMGRAKERDGLGYQDLEMFNLALLAKQGRRLLKRPDTLVGTIFREKYYPNGSFLDSNLGWKPSYTWQSIWVAKSLPHGGLVWRVGNGASIQIWEDRWRPTPGSHKVQSPVNTFAWDAKVEELIDHDTNWWNLELLHNVFIEEEAKVIYSIIVCFQQRNDQLVWAGTRHIDFTVHSAFHMLKEKGIDEEGNSSNAQQLQAIWKGIWKIQGARVVKTFLWQAYNNILRTHKGAVTQTPYYFEPAVWFIY